MTKNFTLKELACPCCSFYNATDELLQRLQDARDLYGSPIKVNSCCRCLKHNKIVGGSSTSSHLHGMAIDVVAISSVTRAKLEEAFWRAGFRRKGVGETFLHFDVDWAKIWPCTWLY